LFELNIQFDWNKDVIKAEYFKDLDIIGKVLSRDPGATARIEGHADKRKLSRAEYNLQLSERRAKACLTYLAAKWNVAPARMVAVGYGFSRPKAKNDSLNGNPVNRRVEVYIRKSGQAEPTAPLSQVEVNNVGAVIPVAAPKGK
jgi:OOP family OmpA-OmpF porin